MKAWHIYDGDPSDSSLLVFAQTRGRAKTLAKKAGLWEYGDFCGIRAKRRSEFDQYSNAESIVETNDDLPAEAPRFYAESPFDWDRQ